MQVEYLDHLPDELKASAAGLYLHALREKYEPILGRDGRAQEALASMVASDNCFVAIRGEEVVGIVGIQTSKGGFVSPRLKTMARIYGRLGGIVRLGGLALLHHTTETDEMYVEGVAVAEEVRGQGIGTRLLELLEQAASREAIRKISLEVIDTNPRARALYERLGFVAVKTETLWPLNLLVRFPFGASTLMVKTLG